MDDKWRLDYEDLLKKIQEAAEENENKQYIMPLKGIAGKPIYKFSSKDDQMVHPVYQ